MPLFQYECKNCHAEAEILVRGAEKPACPHCGSTKLNKLLSAFAPISGSVKRKPVTGCGESNCCRMQGGGCPMN